MVELIKNIYRSLRWNLARIWLLLWPDVEVIGIAGSVGKTTTKEMLFHVLSQTYRTVRTPANWDPIFNIPLTAFRVFGKCMFIVELGIDGIGQMKKYLTLVKPRIGILTRLSLEHTDQDHLKSHKQAIQEELELIRSLPPHGFAILNADDPDIVANAYKMQATRLLYGFGPNARLKISNFRQSVTPEGVRTFFDMKGMLTTDTYELRLLGRHNALNACACVIVGVVMGVSQNKIQQGLLEMKSVEGRLNPKRIGDMLVIDDTYNASPASVEEAINVLVDLDQYNGVLVLGDMLELGNYSEQAHVDVGKYAGSKGVKRLIAYGEMANHVVKGFGKDEFVHAMESHQDIAEWLRSSGTKTIVVKGSRSMKMEKVIELLMTR